jgi:very-short-patch-repair endonuclease
MLSKQYAHLDDAEKKATIEKLYYKENKSLSQIADLLGTYANKIRRDAKKYNLSLRDKSEAQKNALEKGNIKHPTKGKKRSDETKSKIGLSVLNNWDSLDTDSKNQRKEKCKKNWNNLSQDQKEYMQRSANEAVRLASKVGSKLEKYIFAGLLKDGYKVDFHKEQILSNTKLQIDIFLPAANIAIEIDGPSHFEPVWGTQALQRNKKYDNKKTGLILGKGLSLIRIKQTKDFSKSRAQIVYAKLIEQIRYLNDQTTPSSITIGDE